ncbi:conserved hypothetical protein [Vibrio chagasii]|nr:conserved hypothetical protein [Vibrio chagasii]
MRYRIQTLAMGTFPEIEIDQEKFESLQKSRDILNAAMAIEEKYELLISNYLELEKDVLSVTAEYMIRPSRDYSEFFDIRSVFNRRIVNLLTSTKLYIDQIQQHVKVCNLDLVEDVKNEFKKEYGSEFEFRFMEALRNYVQHRGLAVHLTSHPAKWVEQCESDLLEFKTKIYTKKVELEGDKAFKKLVYQEMPEKVDLLLSTRKYVGAISRVHSFIRKGVEVQINAARTLVSDVLDEYSTLNNGIIIGVTAVAYEPGESLDNIVEKVPLLLLWDDVRLELVSKNSCVSNLEKRYVSGAYL